MKGTNKRIKEKKIKLDVMLPTSSVFLSLPTVKACLVATVYYEQLIEQTTLAFVTL